MQIFDTLAPSTVRRTGFFNERASGLGVPIDSRVCELPSKGRDRIGETVDVFTVDQSSRLSRDHGFGESSATLVAGPPASRTRVPLKIDPAEASLSDKRGTRPNRREQPWRVGSVARADEPIPTTSEPPTMRFRCPLARPSPTIRRVAADDGPAISRPPRRASHDSLFRNAEARDRYDDLASTRQTRVRRSRLTRSWSA